MCSVEDCDRKATVRTFCLMHYKRWKRHGDPTTAWPSRHILDRLANKFTVGDGCWMWTAGLDRYGYGQIRYGDTTRAHVVMYQLMVGPVPEGKILDHQCHNDDPACAGGVACLHRRCIRPDHLIPRTVRENVLAGTGLTAQNARKTQCVNGHEFTEENTHVWDQNGHPARRCRACDAARMAESRRRART